MRVLVTGGCGFLGSHICEFYRNQGDEVVSIDNLTKYELMRTQYKVRDVRMYNWKYLKKLGVELYDSDIRNINDKYIDSIRYLAKDCDFICHTAAQPAMTLAIEDPWNDFENNVLGTLNVLETARRYDIPLVSCSTIHIYGNQINTFLTEGKSQFILDPPEINEYYPIMRGDITPLHASKRAGEIYCEAYEKTYGLKIGNYRLSGMYGSRQFGGEDHGWVANFAIRTLLGLPITIYGSDKQVRDILYVSDAALAFDSFFKSQKSGTYNIGGGIENLISLGECLSLIKEITGKKQQINLEGARKGDLWYFCSDLTKARIDLGWYPKVNYKEGLKKTIDWVKENINLFKK